MEVLFLILLTLVVITILFIATFHFIIENMESRYGDSKTIGAYVFGAVYTVLAFISLGITADYVGNEVERKCNIEAMALMETIPSDPENLNDKLIAICK